MGRSEGILPARSSMFERVQLGKYELIARIGEGGMAAVHLARQRGPMNFEKLVVIKTVHPNLAQDQELVGMLLEEARIAALVKHPNVVDIYDLGVEAGTYFIAMEYLDGEPLSSIIRAGRAGRALDPFSTARLVADCAEGLAAAHDLQSLSGEKLDLVHHDVTPANIIVLYTGQVKLVDFGVAKAGAKARSEEERDRLGGKIGYLSPEQLRGERADRRRDIFALGVVLWEALTLRRLFYADSDQAIAQQIVRGPIAPPSSIARGVPTELDDICMHALARDPNERYANAELMAQDIEAFLRSASYAGKNEPIARYMQSVFSHRIQARQELLRQLGSDDGMPSEDTISIVFDVPSDAPPTPPPVSGSHGRGPSPAMLDTLGRPVTEGSSDDVIVTVVDSDDPAAAMAEPSWLPLPPPPVEPEPSGRHGISDLGALSLEAPARARTPRRTMAWTAVAGAIAVLAIILAISRDRPGASPPKPQPAVVDGTDAVAAADPVPSPPPVEAVVEPPVEAIVEPPVEAVVEPPVEAGDDDDDSDRHHHHHRRTTSTTKPDPETATPTADGHDTDTPRSLYKQGLQLFVGGKLDDAMKKFETARKLDPSFAAAYRGIGMVHERRGHKREAAAAFRTYLKLAPSAKDADAIRARIGKTP